MMIIIQHRKNLSDTNVRRWYQLQKKKEELTAARLNKEQDRKKDRQ